MQLEFKSLNVLSCFMFETFRNSWQGCKFSLKYRWLIWLAQRIQIFLLSIFKILISRPLPLHSYFLGLFDFKTCLSGPNRRCQCDLVPWRTIWTSETAECHLIGPRRLSRTQNTERFTEESRTSQDWVFMPGALSIGLLKFLSVTLGIATLRLIYLLQIKLDWLDRH